jgi:calcineurin-like phosphoesterase
MPGKFEAEKENIQMCGAIFTVDEKTRKTLCVERVAIM